MRSRSLLLGLHVLLLVLLLVLLIFIFSIDFTVSMLSFLHITQIIFMKWRTIPNQKLKKILNRLNKQRPNFKITETINLHIFVKIQRSLALVPNSIDEMWRKSVTAKGPIFVIVIMVSKMFIRDPLIKCTVFCLILYSMLSVHNVENIFDFNYREVKRRKNSEGK